MGNFDWDDFIDNLWERENAQGKRGVEGRGGYRNGKYYPYITLNGDTDIGPGFDISHQPQEFKERAKKGFTKEELDSIVKSKLSNEIHYFNQKIANNGGDTTNIPGNVSEGGSINRHKKWDDLSMSEKAEMMKVAVRNGILNLSDIKQKYNEFAEGGDAAKDYNSWKQQISKYLNLNIDEDNTYDYEGYFRKYPQEAWSMLKGSPNAHFTDEFKTVYHPTFSQKSQNNDGSVYSGVVHPKYNPQGLIGGTWSPDYQTFTMSSDGYKGPVSMDDRRSYLEWAEDNGVQLRESDGSLPIYDDIIWGGVLPNVTVLGNRHDSGGSIHIKPENRGKFTALKERTGHSATWFKEHGTPAQRKMATFALNARHWKHGLGGPLVEAANEYGGGGGMSVLLSPMLNSSIFGNRAVEVSTRKTSDNNNLNLLVKAGLNAARIAGLDRKYKGKEDDVHYRQNLFNIVNPLNAVPRSISEGLELKEMADSAMTDKDYPYWRSEVDPSADAAWAKRLGLPYDNTLLIDNPDGSVRLSKQLEGEIPVDTTFLKERIASNERNLEGLRGTPRQVVKDALLFDKEALNALRETYKTGEPVEMNEHSHVNRKWYNNGVFDYQKSPLSLLHRYTVQYDKDNNAMNYWDTYDFDEFEDFVPGNPFKIKGSIKLKK